MGELPEQISRPLGGGVGRGLVVLGQYAAFQIVGVRQVLLHTAVGGISVVQFGEFFASRSRHAKSLRVVGITRHHPVAHSQEDALPTRVVGYFFYKVRAAYFQGQQCPAFVVFRGHFFALPGSVLGVFRLADAVEGIVFPGYGVLGAAQVGRVKGVPIYHIFLVWGNGIVVVL